MKKKTEIREVVQEFVMSKLSGFLDELDTNESMGELNNRLFDSKITEGVDFSFKSKSLSDSPFNEELYYEYIDDLTDYLMTNIIEPKPI